MPELFVDPLELGDRTLEVAELLLAPAAGQAAQPVRARALRSKPLSEEVDDGLVQRLPPTTLLTLQRLREIRWKIPDRQGFDGNPPCFQIDPSLNASEYCT